MPPALAVANSIPKIPYAKYRVCEEELQTSVHSSLAPKMHPVFEVDGGMEASLPHSTNSNKQKNATSSMGSNLRLSRVLERKIDFHLMVEIVGQIDQIQWWNKKHAFIIHTYRSNQGRLSFYRESSVCCPPSMILGSAAPPQSSPTGGCPRTPDT